MSNFHIIFRFDTSIGGLLYSDQILQIATRLPTNNVYGMGENTHHSLRHSFNDYRTYPLFPMDHKTGDVSKMQLCISLL